MSASVPKAAMRTAALSAAILAAACWLGWRIPVNNDVGWQYWVARQLRGGAVLYRDIVEVNPPLWFWEAVPLSALADRLHVASPHMVVVAVMLRVAVSMALMDRLLAHEETKTRLTLLVCQAAILAVMPIHDFAEREHLMLIGALPYAAMIGRRLSERPVGRTLALTTAAFAAYAFALKPHFALVPISTEALLALTLRRSWRPVRPETAVLAGGAALYGAAILLFAPDYVRTMLPMAIAAYGAFSPPAIQLLARLWMPSCLFGAAALAFGRDGMGRQARCAAAVAAALAAAYFIQGKGFSYHGLAVAASIAWALCWQIATPGPGSLLRRTLAVPALAFIAATCIYVGPFRQDDAGLATEAFYHQPPGTAVAVVSAHSWHSFPAVEEHRYVWTMRTNGLWTIPEIAREGQGPHATAQGVAIRDWTLRNMAQDLWCRPPDVILFDDPRRSPALRGTDFSYEDFARSDPDLRRLLSGYRATVADQGATLYTRTASIAPRGSGCRTIAVAPDNP